MAQDEKKVSFRQRWNEVGRKWNKARPTKKIVFWISVAVSILTMIVGFSWGGWVTSSKAELMTEEAVVERLALICVDQFKQDPETEQKLIEFVETSSYKQDDYVRDQGWATMFGDEEPDKDVADACAKLIAQIDQ
jgi:alpha/beta superfamily hydrolase